MMVLLSFLLSPCSAAAGATGQFKFDKLHPIVEEQLTEESDGTKWFKENWGLDDDSGWINFVKDMEVILAEPDAEIVEDEKTSSLCRSEPARDLRWKYCGFYTGLKTETVDERTPAEDFDQLLKFEVRPQGFVHFTVLDIQNEDAAEEVARGVTIKFFFDYEAPEEEPEPEEETPGDKDFATKVYDDFITTAVSNERRQ